MIFCLLTTFFLIAIRAVNAGSCKNYCGLSPPPAPGEFGCGCDGSCTKYNDCCPDFCSLCAKAPVIIKNVLFNPRFCSTLEPTTNPTVRTTGKPTIAPTGLTKGPTMHPTTLPTGNPTSSPTFKPTKPPSYKATLASRVVVTPLIPPPPMFNADWIQTRMLFYADENSFLSDEVALGSEYSPGDRMFFSINVTPKPSTKLQVNAMSVFSVWVCQTQVNIPFSSNNYLRENCILNGTNLFAPISNGRPNLDDRLSLRDYAAFRKQDKDYLSLQIPKEFILDEENGKKLSIQFHLKIDIAEKSTQQRRLQEKEKLQTWKNVDVFFGVTIDLKDKTTITTQKGSNQKTKSTKTQQTNKPTKDVIDIKIQQKDTDTIGAEKEIEKEGSTTTSFFSKEYGLYYILIVGVLVWIACSICLYLVWRMVKIDVELKSYETSKRQGVSMRSMTGRNASGKAMSIPPDEESAANAMPVSDILSSKQQQGTSGKYIVQASSSNVVGDRNERTNLGIPIEEDDEEEEEEEEDDDIEDEDEEDEEEDETDDNEEDDVKEIRQTQKSESSGYTADGDLIKTSEELMMKTGGGGRHEKPYIVDTSGGKTNNVNDVESKKKREMYIHDQVKKNILESMNLHSGKDHIGEVVDINGQPLYHVPKNSMCDISKLKTKQ